MSSRTVLTVTAAGLLVAATAGGGMLWVQQRSDSGSDDAATSAAMEFARAISDRKVDRVPYEGMTAQQAGRSFRAVTAQLGDGNVLASVQRVDRSKDTARATVSVAWPVPGGATYRWTTPVVLVHRDDTWKVRADGSRTWHPALGPKDHLVVNRLAAQRGEIVGRGGAPLMSNRPVHDVFLDPASATPESIAQIERVTGIGGLADRVAKAKKDGSGRVHVVTYRTEDWTTRRDGLRGKGVVTRERTQPLADERTFGQPLLGGVGPITPEMVQKEPNRFSPGMFAGVSGLQRQYDAHMSGSDGLTVSSSGKPDVALFTAKGEPGKDLVTTLDPAAQEAAEKVLSSLPSDRAAALVAIDVPSGSVLAAASSPSYGVERALSGRYSPGSTFKITSAYRAIAKGLNPAAKVPCPREIKVDGRAFRNYEGESMGTPSFAQNFAHSCNTAFIKATEKFTANDSQAGAAPFGVGADYAGSTGVTGAVSGSVPTAAGATDRAAMSIGQGRILMSPLAVAAMAADVARGSHRAPGLVATPAAADRPTTPLDPKAVNALRSMMRSAVTDGTATLLTDAQGGPVHAKTGTAEFSEGGRSGAHAWVAGYQGNVAFAVLVTDVPKGQGGGSVAAPVAKSFLDAVANTP